jgi:hypothetical protein
MGLSINFKMTKKFYNLLKNNYYLNFLFLFNNYFFIDYKNNSTTIQLATFYKKFLIFREGLQISSFHYLYFSNSIKKVLDFLLLFFQNYNVLVNLTLKKNNIFFSLLHFFFNTEKIFFLNVLKIIFIVFLMLIFFLKKYFFFIYSNILFFILNQIFSLFSLCQRLIK